MADKMRPITPDEIEHVRKAILPDAVFESFNELIAQNWDGNSATIKQKDVVALMAAKGLDRLEIYDKHWLDIEGIYRLMGWKVTYDKPGFTESYDAMFIFRSLKKTE